MQSDPFLRRSDPADGAPYQDSEELQIQVHIDAEDDILRAGTVEQLRHRPEIRISDTDDRSDGAISLSVFDSFDSAAMHSIRLSSQSGSAGIVLVVGKIQEDSIPDLVSCGVNAILRRKHATPEKLTQVISGVAQGEGSIPGDLVGHLLRQLTQCGCRESRTCSGRGSELTDRERRALSCAADGYSTQEIAKMMGYSERTIKVILSGVVGRCNLRNRTQAVAYAIRKGLIP
ncbi:response regulator transcription factor [Streptomyces lavendulae]|uniref:response regulator transcription factor n=1 Tax=Streptomyces lavendulae TaxID=1914 RepID=UPI003718A941